LITTLEKVKEGMSAVVKQVYGGHRIRQRLGGLGIHVDDTLKVLRTGFLGGPVLIAIHGTEVGIGQGMAEKIEVEVMEEE
jgi:Fe2+ transport system protein FeoA